MEYSEKTEMNSEVEELKKTLAVKEAERNFLLASLPVVNQVGFHGLVDKDSVERWLQAYTEWSQAVGGYTALETYLGAP